MTIKITELIQTLLFCIIAGQAFFYLIGGAAGLKNVSAGAFIEQRKAIDLVIAPWLKIIYPLSIVVSVAVLMLLGQPIGSSSFVLSLVALVLILADMVIAIRGDVPINREIQSWSVAAHPAHWADLRDQWFAYMRWRQLCSITGLLCLLLRM